MKGFAGINFITGISLNSDASMCIEGNSDGTISIKDKADYIASRPYKAMGNVRRASGFIKPSKFNEE